MAGFPDQVLKTIAKIQGKLSRIDAEHLSGIFEIAGLSRDGRENLGQSVVRAITKPANLGPYEPIAPTIPCLVCAPGACVHGVLAPWPTRKGTFAAEHTMSVMCDPVILPGRDDRTQTLTAPAPSESPASRALFRSSLIKSFGRKYEDAWQRILDDDPYDNPSEAIEVVLATARRRLISPTSWWPGRDLAVGAGGPCSPSSTDATKWSIAGSLYVSGDSEASRNALIFVASDLFQSRLTSWVDADMRLARWNAEPGRSYCEVVDRIKDLHDCMRKMI